MTTKEVFQTYENHLASLVGGYCTAEEEARYDEGDILAAFLAELDTAEDRGATCGAELADEIRKYERIQYYVNLMTLRNSSGNKYTNPVRNT